MAMARLLQHMSLIAPAIISLLLLLAALAPGPAATAAQDTPVKKVGMRIRYANKEEAQWLDHYAETHQPLGAGPLSMVRATPEEEHWLNRFSDDVATTDDSEDGASGRGYIDFDDDNPYIHALRDWVIRLTKQSMEKAAQEENSFQRIFRDAWRPSINSEWYMEDASEELV